ncbi:MAG: fused MFS/spermidine synthase [Bacteroidota bacterium]|nr:fused MFS/spermidine synthase [Bacteroidota bacterium]
MKNIILYVITFFSGAAIAAIELLGTRILAPYYGVSLFLSSALISSMLIALSISFLIGGRIADNLSTSRLYLFLGISGIWFLLIAWISPLLLDLLKSVEPQLGALIAICILFLIPQLLLGIIIFITIKEKTKSGELSVRTMGNMFAVAAVGAAVSLILTRYLLLPYVGITRTCIIFGCVLLLMTILEIICARNTILTMLISIIISVIGSISLLFCPEKLESMGIVVQEVNDNEQARSLLIDGRMRALVDTKTWDSKLRYTAVMELPMHFFTKPGKMLLFGLGSGSIAKKYIRHNWEVEIVEPGSEMITLTQKHFGLSSSEVKIYNDDGRRLLKNHVEKYDVILLDAVSGRSYPFHMMTKEFFNLITEHLNDGGIFSISVESIGWNDDIVESLSATLKQCFRQVIVLPITEPPNKFSSIVLFATAVPRDDFIWDVPRNDDYSPFWRFGPDYQKIHAWDNRFVSKDGQILTDDLNSLEILYDRLNIHARRQSVEYFP